MLDWWGHGGADSDPSVRPQTWPLKVLNSGNGAFLGTGWFKQGILRDDVSSKTPSVAASEIQTKQGQPLAHLTEIQSCFIKQRSQSHSRSIK